MIDYTREPQLPGMSGIIAARGMVGQPPRAGMLGYPPREGLPIIPRQRIPEDPEIVGCLDSKEWHWPFAGIKTDLYFQELLARQPRCA